MINYETPRRAFLEYVVFVLFKRKWLILWGFLAVFLSIYLAVKITYPMYLGTSKVWVHRSAPSQDVNLFPDVQRPNFSMSITSPGYNWTEVVNSQSMAMEAVKEFHLDEIYRQRSLDPQDFREYFWYYFRKILFFPVKIPEKLGFWPPPVRDFFATATSKFQSEMITVGMASQVSDVVTISVYAPTPRLAQDIANFLAERLIVRVVEGEQNAARFAMDFAQKQVADISTKLSEVEDSFLAYKKRMEILDVDQQKKEIITYADSLQARIMELQRSQQEMETKMQTLDEQIEAQKKAYVSSVVLQKNFSDWEGAVQNLNGIKESIPLLQEQLRSVHKRATELTEAEFVHSKLSREIDIYSKIWSQFEDKMAKLNIETISKLKEVSMEVIDRAHVPDSADPTFPDSTIINIIGAILAIITGVALAFIIEYYNDSLRSPTEAEKELNIPVFASIPEFRLPKKL